MVDSDEGCGSHRGRPPSRLRVLASPPWARSWMRRQCQIDQTTTRRDSFTRNPYRMISHQCGSTQRGAHHPSRNPWVVFAPRPRPSTRTYSRPEIRGVLNRRTWGIARCSLRGKLMFPDDEEMATCKIWRARHHDLQSLIDRFARSYDHHRPHRSLPHRSIPSRSPRSIWPTHRRQRHDLSKCGKAGLARGYQYPAVTENTADNTTITRKSGLVDSKLGAEP